MAIGIRRIWEASFGRSHRDIRIALAQTTALLQEVRDEVKPNNGGSMKDSITRIEARQIKQEARNNAFHYTDHRALFETDVTGKVTGSNRAHQTLTGFSPEEIENDGWINMVHEDDRERISMLWKNAFKSQRTLQKKVRCVHPKDNQEYLVDMNVTRQLDDNNVAHGYLGILTKVD